jgi:hypothetical protein
MGDFFLEGVQKILHLDLAYPDFQTWEETLEFDVVGVKVKALATHSWRRIVIHIIEPFSILAWYFEPPLFALGFSMLQRQIDLKIKGFSERDDCIQRAKKAYIRHAAYLRFKPKIDAAQEEFFREYRDELASLKLVSLDVEARVALKKVELRRAFKTGKIGQTEYQSSLKQQATLTWNARLPYFDLQRKVDHQLSDIKNSMIDQILSDESKQA